MKVSLTRNVLSTPGDSSEIKKGLAANKNPSSAASSETKAAAAEYVPQIKSDDKGNTKFTDVLKRALHAAESQQTGKISSDRNESENLFQENSLPGSLEDKSETDLNDGVLLAGETVSGGYGQNIDTQKTIAAAAEKIISSHDLERIISTVKTQINLAGNREVLLELNQSVLDGLKVKIVTDQALQVQIEFLVSDKKFYSKISSRLDELDGRLRARRINLQGIKVSVDSKQKL